jgi:hypothetical protein
MAYPNFNYTPGQPLYGNAMGRSPIPAGGAGGWGAPAGGSSPEFATVPEGTAPPGAGVDWMKLLQATAPILAQMQERRGGGAAAAPAMQPMQGNPAASTPLLMLMQRQPLTDPSGRALPGLLG